MDTKILEYIIAIAEEKSVSRAADRFYLSQSVVSHHLKNLEEEFGEPFFVRDPRGMQLTRAGIIFVNNARTILHMESQLEAKMEAMRRQQNKSIRVMVDSTNRNFFIRRILTAFRAEFPSVSLELTDCNFIQAHRTLLTGGTDLAVCCSNRQEFEGCSTQLLFQTCLHFLLPAGKEHDFSLEEFRSALEKNMMVSLHPVGSSMRLVEEDLLAQGKAFPSVIMESRGFLNSLSLVQDGQCGVFYPQAITFRDAANLREVPDLQSPLYTQMIWLEDTKHSKSFNRLLEIVKEAYLEYPQYIQKPPAVSPA